MLRAWYLAAWRSTGLRRRAGSPRTTRSRFVQCTIVRSTRAIVAVGDAFAKSNAAAGEAVVDISASRSAAASSAHRSVVERAKGPSREQRMFQRSSDGVGSFSADCAKKTSWDAHFGARAGKNARFSRDSGGDE